MHKTRFYALITVKIVKCNKNRQELSQKRCEIYRQASSFAVFDQIFCVNQVSAAYARREFFAESIQRFVGFIVGFGKVEIHQ